MKKVNKLLMSLFFILLGIYVVWVATQRPRIFVLQSYTNNYSWTRDVDAAIHKVFDATQYNVRYHYMDTKAHSDEDFKRVAGSLARKQINEWKPDILIAIDDNAQSLVAVCYVDKSKLPPGHVPRVMKDEYSRSIFGECFESNKDLQILYSGIGARPEDYGFNNQPHISGILERMDVPALRDTLLIIAQRTNTKDLKVTAPIDSSTSGTYNLESLKRLKAEMVEYGITVVPEVIRTFDEWSEMVERTNKDSDMLLLSNYHTIKCSTGRDAERVSPRALIEWTEAHSNIPGVGAWGFYTEDGGMMSVGVSPYEQGKVVARMAKKIVENDLDAWEVPIKTTRQSIIFIREGLMSYYYGTELPRIYEAFARGTGNYYECKDQAELSVEETLSADHCKKDIEEIREKKQKKLTNVQICVRNTALSRL